MKRLWRRLINKKPPTLVVPVPEIGPSDGMLQRVCQSDRQKIREENIDDIIPDDRFLFGACDVPSKHFVMTLPSDPMVMGLMYNGVRKPREGEVRPSVTYDPGRASEQLEYYLPQIGQKGNQ